MVRGPALVSLIAASLLIVPVAQAALLGDVASGPSDACAGCPSPADPSSTGPWAWTETASIPQLERRARAAVMPGATHAPAPDRVPGYDDVPEQAKRVAWRSWMRRAALDRAAPSGPILPTVGSAAGGGSSGDGTIRPRNLSDVWSRPAHGAPIDVLPARGDAHYVLTTRGVLRFPEPGADPEWMVTVGYATTAEMTHVDDDGVPDLVVGVYSFSFFSDDAEPSIAVVDGATGEVLFTGFSGEAHLWSWTTTDVDGDDGEEILGLTVDGRLLAASMDGETVFESGLPSYPTAGRSVGVAAAGLVYQPPLATSFADVDDDGAKDALVPWSGVAYGWSILGGEQASVAHLSALSGAGGEEIWRATFEVDQYKWIIPTAAGDLTGDGRADPVVLEYGFRFTYAFPAYVYSDTEATTTLDGEDGSILSRDAARRVFAGAVVGAGQQIGSMPWFPTEVLDLDGDGSREIVSVEVETKIEDDRRVIETVYVTGRVPGQAPRGPTEEIYRHEVDLSSADLSGVREIVQDLDADNATEYGLLTIRVQLDDDAFGGWNGSIHVVDEGEIGATHTDAVLGLYGATPSGDGVGWTLADDRWTGVAGDGRVADGGTRLLVSTYPVEVRDRDGDGVQDLLVPKAFGYTWIDGETGQLLGDVAQSPLRYTHDVVVEEGETRILESRFTDDELFLRDLDGNVAWTLDDDDHDGFIADYTDLVGDGRGELVTVDVDFTGDGVTHEYAAIDPRSGDAIWDEEDEELHLAVVDAIPSRAGEELVLVGDDVEVQVADETEPRWSEDLDDRDVVEAEDGWVLLTGGDDENRSLSALHGANGSVAATFELSGETWIDEILVDPIAGASKAEVAMVLAEGEEIEERAYRAVVWNPSEDATAARFDVRDAEVLGTFEFAGETFTYYDTPDLIDTVAGWNGDGRDLVLAEPGQMTIRDVGSGRLLAVAGGESWFVETPDVDGDGVDEVVDHRSNGRLAVLRYEAGADVATPGTITTIPDPAGPTAGPASLADAEGGLLPGPGLLVTVAAAAVALVVWGRRRAGPKP